MARLTRDDLALEITYRRFDAGWVVYDILWTINGQPMINDAVLKRHNDYWGGRARGGWHVSEHLGCCVIPLIKKVLKTNQADYKETTDPAMTLAIYPDGGFPFLPSRTVEVYVSPEEQQRRDRFATLKEEEGNLPSDLFQIIMFIDIYNFAGVNAYYGDGLALHIATNREQLEQFADELSDEYEQFKRDNQVDEYVRELHSDEEDDDDDESGED